MGKYMKKRCVLLFVFVLLVNIGSLNAVSFPQMQRTNERCEEDFDPLVDVELTITIDAIRALGRVDCFSEPDFFVQLFVNDEKFISPVWNDAAYVYPSWSVVVDVPDDVEYVDVVIQVWDAQFFKPRLCDINEAKNTGLNGYDLHLLYSIKTGRWSGDDSWLGDISGYGRGCGNSDENDRAAELWFSIIQNDYDNDTLPYWVETQVYGTDPTFDNRGDDADGDSVPIEWEHRWGFNPFIWDDHMHLDPDSDSISNFEEYLTKDFGSDPFRKDVFLELDFMQETIDGKPIRISNYSLELLKNPFHRRNIVFHVDIGQLGGGDSIPYSESVTFDDVRSLYDTYFLAHEATPWKRGVFHYGLIVMNCSPGGYAFSGDVFPYFGYFPGTNGFVISNTTMNTLDERILTKSIDYIYGSAIMHEMGHNFGIRLGHPFGCDAQRSKRPWQFGYWWYRNYKSIMNYRYTYSIFDYSDGSHGTRDFNDWNAIDLSYFEIPSQDQKQEHLINKRLS